MMRLAAPPAPGAGMNRTFQYTSFAPKKARSVPALRAVTSALRIPAE
jgi:hypothetical protein